MLKEIPQSNLLKISILSASAMEFGRTAKEKLNTRLIKLRPWNMKTQTLHIEYSSTDL